MLSHISLFSGYEGFGMGMRLAGVELRTVLYCENEPYPQDILRARIRDGYLDDAPIWPDIRTLDGRPFAGKVGLITAGFPCQPHSVAGLREGEDDDRNLWPDTLRIIREVGSKYAMLENVPGILVRSDDGRPAYGGTVVGELAEAGYDAEWRVVSAASAGAPHLRKRWWLVAHAHPVASRGIHRELDSSEGTGAGKAQ